jgi:hypothetical protein
MFRILLGVALLTLAGCGAAAPTGSGEGPAGRPVPEASPLPPGTYAGNLDATLALTALGEAAARTDRLNPALVVDADGVPQTSDGRTVARGVRTVTNIDNTYALEATTTGVVFTATGVEVTYDAALSIAQPTEPTPLAGGAAITLTGTGTLSFVLLADGSIQVTDTADLSGFTTDSQIPVAANWSAAGSYAP